MPVITRRQPLLDLRGKTASLALSDTLSLQSPCEDNDSKPLYFLTDVSFAQKEMEFPGSESPARPLKAASKSRSNLRLTTQSPLHSRYQSSEEDISPSPDSSSAASSSDEAEAEAEEPTPTHKPTDVDFDPVPALDDSTDLDSDADSPVPTTPPAVATRISFFHAGRPKLISIAALAPLQKRKRAIPPPLRHTDSTNPSTHTTNSLPSPNPSSEYHSAPTSPPAKRPTTAIRSKPSPAVWLSTDCDDAAMSLSESEEADDLLLGHPGAPYPSSHRDAALAPLVDPALHAEHELYFPPAELGSPTPTTYAEYDPYSLDPPRLSGGSSEYARKYAAFAGGAMGGPGAAVWESERRKGWKVGFGRVVKFGKRGGCEAGVGKGRVEGQGREPLLGAFVFEE